MIANTGGWNFWIDRGGTFTDVVACAPDGSLRSVKLLSENPTQYTDAAAAGIRQCLDSQSTNQSPRQTIAAIRMGTTVATNALLERKGDRTALVITRGFADALRIGYQNRPDIFALQIQLPQLLHQCVIEAQERMSADGEVLVPLDTKKLRHDLIAARDAGFDSIAIALMHSWCQPQHEILARDIAAEIGFGQISVSHLTNPVIRLISRADTTVADAYLSPLLERYVSQFTHQLNLKDKSRVLFMQSSGGLTAAGQFRGKDAVLSGPAGGVVGMVETARQHGAEKVIGFDMGGTSTDVTLFDGHFERNDESVVAGVRLRAPMLSIHTVAAGGGSVLRYAQQRLQVGPESSGANPGPACYRNGGPLSLTDANVMLGCIRPEYFPAIFGADGCQHLDSATVEHQFSQLAAKINSENSPTVSFTATSLAEGYVQIGVGLMANAIKKISTQRGHDIREFMLNCFGGAGGQHACRVADALGISKVLIHPLAGVLSAYGMGLADIRAVRQSSVESELNEAGMEKLRQICTELAARANADLDAQKLGLGPRSTETTVRLRYAGTDNSIATSLNDINSMRADFEAQHLQQFGFTVQAGLVIDSAQVEAVFEQKLRHKFLSNDQKTTAKSIAQHPVSMSTGLIETPFYNRGDLGKGTIIKGPAVLLEETATTVIEPHWQAKVAFDDALILTLRQKTQQQKKFHTQVDPVLLEVFNHLYMNIAERMGAVLRNTARSINIKERLDFSCAVFDDKGNLVANAPHMPVHLGSMGESVRAVINANSGGMQPGNVYLINAPYSGGTHLPDLTVVTPVFDRSDSRILFYVASRGHHSDIGGISPGSMPALSTNIDQEGIVFDNFLLVHQDRFCETELLTALASGPWPARNPQHNVADLKAQVAANRCGVNELRVMTAHFGLATVLAYMQHVQDNAAASVQSVIERLKPGEFCYQLDNDLKIQVRVDVDRKQKTAIVDFHGSSDQSPGNFNAPFPVCRAAVLYVFRTLVPEPIPMNEGCLRHIDIRVPKASLLDPRYPAAVVAGNVETSQCITNALYGALGILAAAQGTMNNLTFGDSQFQYYETICGGTGAGDGFDGSDAVHSHMTNSRLTDPEVLEWRYPVLVRDFSIRPDSGGQGQWRGGNGVSRTIEFRQNMTATILSNHRSTAPPGLKGGSPGKVGCNMVWRNNSDCEKLGATQSIEVKVGDALVIKTPGGGGWGNAPS